MERTMRAVIVCLAMLLSIPSYATTPPGSSFQIFRDGLLHIGVGAADDRGAGTIDRWLGTGILVDDVCTIATTTHVLEDADPESLVARFQHPGDLTMAFTRQARIVHRDENSGLAFLRIVSPGNRPCSSGSLRPFPLGAAVAGSDLTGEPVLVAGYPNRGEQEGLDVPVLRRGTISCTEIHWAGRPMILLDMRDLDPFAGSPVILESTGKVIGLAVGKGPRGDGLELEWAIPITVRDCKAIDGQD